MATATQDSSKDGTVNWDAAKEFFTGKAKSADGEAPDAAADDGEQTQESQLVEVSIKGRKVKMAPEDAAVFEEFRREVRERDGRLGGENAQMRERLARLEGQVEAGARAPRTTTPALTPPDPKLVETDFASYHNQMVAYHAAKMAEMASDLESRYETEKAQERTTSEEDRRSTAWANRFYAKYDHLDDQKLKPFVVSVYAANQAEILAAGGLDEQQERLAALVDEALVQVKGNKRASSSTKPPRLEGGSTPTPGKVKETSTERTPLTASRWVAQKRAALRGGK